MADVHVSSIIWKSETAPGFRRLDVRPWRYVDEAGEIFPEYKKDDEEDARNVRRSPLSENRSWKITLINNLAQEDRVIGSDIAGTTKMRSIPTLSTMEKNMCLSIPQD